MISSEEREPGEKMVHTVYQLFNCDLFAEHARNQIT